MKAYLNFMFILGFAFTTHAYNATQFFCVNGSQTLQFSINSTNDAINHIMFLVDSYSWTPESSQVDELSYQTIMQGSSNRINDKKKNGLLEI